MAALVWNVSAEKKYESGLDRGALYPQVAGAYPAGYAWEGLMSVTEKPGGAEITDLWANNAKYAQLQAIEIFDGSIEAYTFPYEFLAALGIEADVTGSSEGWLHQQARQAFGLTYRTFLGSDAGGQQESYKIHCIYGCLLTPSEVARTTINDSPEATSFSWEFKTTPVSATGYSAVSKLTFDTGRMTAGDVTAVEDQIWSGSTPALLLPDGMLALLTGA
jgi:hypothetical protein